MPRSRWTPPREWTDADVADLERRKLESLKRSTHPDLIPGTNELAQDIDLPVPQRDFLRMWSDPAQQAAFMQQVAARQARESPEVQHAIQGRSFGADAYTGYLEYQREIDLQRRVVGRDRELTSADIARMSTSEYDRLFDARGQLSDEARREGYTFKPSSRDVDLRGGADAYTQRELRQPG